MGRPAVSLRERLVVICESNRFIAGTLLVAFATVGSWLGIAPDSIIAQAGLVALAVIALCFALAIFGLHRHSPGYRPGIANARLRVAGFSHLISALGLGVLAVFSVGYLSDTDPTDRESVPPPTLTIPRSRQAINLDWDLHGIVYEADTTVILRQLAPRTLVGSQFVFNDGNGGYVALTTAKSVGFPGQGSGVVFFSKSMQRAESGDPVTGRCRVTDDQRLGEGWICFQPVALSLAKQYLLRIWSIQLDGSQTLREWGVWLVDPEGPRDLLFAGDFYTPLSANEVAKHNDVC